MGGLNIVKLTNLDLELPDVVQLMWHDQKTWNSPIMLGLIMMRKQNWAPLCSIMSRRIGRCGKYKKKRGYLFDAKCVPLLNWWICRYFLFCCRSVESNLGDQSSTEGLKLWMVCLYKASSYPSQSVRSISKFSRPVPKQCKMSARKWLNKICATDYHKARRSSANANIFYIMQHWS